MKPAAYESGVLPGAVWIVDLCKPLAASVTNDAERVIADLAASGVDFSGRRVVYMDSTGRWDEIVVEGGRFVGFAPIGAATREAALVHVGAVLSVQAQAAARCAERFVQKVFAGRTGHGGNPRLAYRQMGSDELRTIIEAAFELGAAWQKAQGTNHG